MYDYLASKGSRYARLANGVATGESFAGKAAIKFMQQAASEVGKPMGQDLVNGIRQAMAESYLATIKRIADYGDGVLLRELNYKEIEGFTLHFRQQRLQPRCLDAPWRAPILPEGARSLEWIECSMRPAIFLTKQRFPPIRRKLCYWRYTATSPMTARPPRPGTTASGRHPPCSPFGSCQQPVPGT